MPTLRLNDVWESIFEREQRSHLEELLRAYIGERRWFGGKARAQRRVTITEAIPICTGATSVILVLIRFEYLDDTAETYLLPLAFATGSEATRLEAEAPALALARTDGATAELHGILYDATGSADFGKALLDAIIRRRKFEGGESCIECSPTSALDGLLGRAGLPLVPKLSTAEQSNTTIRFGDRLILKLFRRPDNGINPEVELGRALTGRHFQNAPPLAGAIEYRAKDGERRTLAVLHGFVAGATDGWEYTLKELGHFHERVRSLGELERLRIDGEAESLLGAYLEAARLLGRRTAEMHLALAADRAHPDFAPEPFTPDYQRRLCDSMCQLALRNLSLLRSGLGPLTGESRTLAAAVIAMEDRIIGRFSRFADTPLTALRIRVHGDYHLGQTLCAGGDFFIVDFEGEPAVSLSERRMKQTPFTDVAGLLRSFDYAANAALRREIDRGAISPSSQPCFTAWADRWTRWVSAAFLESYLARVGTSDILPASAAGRALLLDTHLLRKAVYELGYEANNRPEWLPIPCRGILTLIAGKEEN